MAKKQILKIYERALLFGLIFSIISGLTRFDASCEDMRNNILRIHILANSDSSLDQNVKLKVRDELLNNTDILFSDCDTLEIAKHTAKQNINEFKGIADCVLKQNGLDYTASAKIGKAFFGTRKYEGFTLPAGYYDALIITLGKGRGHNWWCVIYPSVCLGGSAKKLDKSISEKSYRIATHPKKYKMRFKIVELYEKLKRKTKKHKKHPERL